MSVQVRACCSTSVHSDEDGHGFVVVSSKPVTAIVPVPSVTRAVKVLQPSLPETVPSEKVSCAPGGALDAVPP